ncbi:hypothetical protein [Mediterraneibacter massiliensis]|uniref:hypothetical protein n=1 Tax=Mediterraneibacter massiliensis TaxID=1720300 RepID=UPI003AB929C0
MSRSKPEITEKGIDHILVGDYCIRDLKLPEEHRFIGRYGWVRRCNNIMTGRKKLVCMR